MITQLARFAFAFCVLLFLGPPPAHGNVAFSSKLILFIMLYVLKGPFIFFKLSIDC